MSASSDGPGVGRGQLRSLHEEVLQFSPQPRGQLVAVSPYAPGGVFGAAVAPLAAVVGPADVTSGSAMGGGSGGAPDGALATVAAT